MKLISVVILSYNSSETILETLDSIKAQSYENIELIVTDDASKDNSVELCQQWKQQHGERFARMIVLPSEKNGGISANANQGCRAALGEWLKVLAADDLLTPNALSDLATFVEQHQDADIVFSKVKPIGDEQSAREWPYFDPGLLLERMSRKQMMYKLFDGNFLPAASAFISRKCYHDLGGYEESIPLMEDWPFWIKAVCHHKQLAFLDSYTALYRFSPKSVSQGTDWQQDPNSRYYQTQRRAELFADAYKKRFTPLLWMYQRSKKEHQNKGSLLWRFIYFWRIMNPYYHMYKKWNTFWEPLWKQHLERNRQVLLDAFG